MNDQIRYFRFVAKFVDAVTTEPLVQALRKQPEPLRLRAKAPHRLADAEPTMPRAA